MKRQTDQINGAIRSVVTKEYAAVNKRIVLSAATFAAFAVFGLAVAGGSVARADKLDEPAAAPSAADVLRTYPLPGDPHDAVASFNELIGVGAVSVVSEVLRTYPMPGDLHDFGFSMDELTGKSIQPRVTIPVAASIVPMPGDPHDAAVQLAEFYESRQAETQSRIRLSD
jgi:hypothetical protein